MKSTYITPRQQRGAALVTGLIFMVVLTLLSLSAIKATALEERMAGNARDQDLAFQAAEAAVRDAMINVLPNLKTSSPFVAGCASGLCKVGVPTPVWETITANNDWNSSKTASYGQAIPSVAAQPRYIIELVQGSFAPTGFSAGSGKNDPTVAYRITARGWGFTTQANATVQSTFFY